jgi:methyl-accepting chemotaxis protein
MLTLTIAASIRTGYGSPLAVAWFNIPNNSINRTISRENPIDTMSVVNSSPNPFSCGGGVLTIWTGLTLQRLHALSTMKTLYTAFRSIGWRLAAAFAALVLISVLVAALEASQTRAMGDRLRGIVEVDNVKRSIAGQLLDEVNVIAIQARTVTLLTDVKAIEREAAALKAAQARYEDALHRIDGQVQGPGGSDAERSALELLRERGRLALEKVAVAVQQGQDGRQIDAVNTIIQDVRPLEVAWQAGIAALVALEDRQSMAAYQAAQAARRSSSAVAAAAVVLAGTVGGLVSWRMTRAVTAPMDRAVAVAERIARGDLTGEVGTSTGTEAARLLHAIGAMQGRLREVVHGIRESVGSVHHASVEISSGTRHLGDRTEMAAANLQQTAGTMEQLAATVRQTAEAASSASAMAQTAAGVAAQGGEAVTQVVRTMESISSSSRQIASIVGLIDSIAFQTNILALNAAVEAARAGEQGRGFAVVAAEVRTLAKRSAQAAKEIAQLVSANVEGVSQGSRLVSDAGATLVEAVSGARRVEAILSELAATTSEQNVGIAEVSAAVAQLETLTQSNAALVEQSTAATRGLEAQAGHLSELVSAFNVTDSRSVGLAY